MEKYRVKFLASCGQVLDETVASSYPQSFYREHVCLSDIILFINGCFNDF
jgi:hypothetical protein